MVKRDSMALKYSLDGSNPLVTDGLVYTHTCGNIMLPGISVDGGTEGTHHNPELIVYFARGLAEALGEGGTALDVGPGDNVATAYGFSKAGYDVIGIDTRSAVGDPPRETEIVRGKRDWESKSLRVYRGAISRILDHDSLLKNTKFDVVYFWGSMAAGGENWTVKELAYSPAFHENDGELSDDEDIESVICDSLRSARDVLNPKGKLAVVSSRYAFHGAGYPISRIPDEMKEFELSLRRGYASGAKTATVYGLSKNKTSELLDRVSRFYINLADDYPTLNLRNARGKKINPVEIVVNQLSAARKALLDHKRNVGRVDAVVFDF